MNVCDENAEFVLPQFVRTLQSYDVPLISPVICMVLDEAEKDCQFELDEAFNSTV